MIINLYPFEETTYKKNVDEKDVIENIDIGGPSMIRATAKNFNSKAIITDPNDYDNFITELKENKCSVSNVTRRELAIKAFRKTAMYDAAIHKYFSDSFENEVMPDQLLIGLRKISSLRYGENPHQTAALYTSRNKNNGLVNATIHQGKELSYNNFLDANTAMKCVLEFDQPACVIVKHVNPCGVAIGTDLINAYQKSFATDPESAFGGVIAVNRLVDESFASELINNQFLEVLIAPEYNQSALDILKEKKNVRVISKNIYSKEKMPFSIQAIDGGYLVQEDDWSIIDENELDYVTEKKPDEQQIIDLIFAWKVCKYVKSNAIVFAKDLQTIGIGAGQMSRVNSAKIASLKASSANLDTENSVMASDGFFPFSDSIEMASENKISCIIQPGGSIKDEEVITEANNQGIAMVMTGMRHFRH
jgi:phosphoribosylaminoimidazolecarboxamide formyltransferase/IMP cyclohydrolase